MPDIRGLRFSLLLICLVVVLVTMGCDDEPKVFDTGPATDGGVEFEVSDYHIRYLELTSDSGETIEYPDPVLAVGLEITNVGEDELSYSPTHASRDMSEARNVQLYRNPQATEIDWEQFSPESIRGVYLQRGSWEQQQQDSLRLAVGESVTDYFLFELPDSDDNKLMLSIPPAMHRGEMPVFLRFDYAESERHGPAVHQVGDEIEFEGVTFVVTDIEQTYIELEDSSEGEGFSNDPVLKISYTITNDSEETVRFDARHRDVSGNEGALVQSLHTDFTRVRFSANAEPVGQKGQVDIEPGESIDDFTTFELPTDRAESATFVLPATHFDRSGRVRVAFSYEPEEVELPEELQQD